MNLEHRNGSWVTVSMSLSVTFVYIESKLADAIGEFTLVFLQIFLL